MLHDFFLAGRTTTVGQMSEISEQIRASHPRLEDACKAVAASRCVFGGACGVGGVAADRVGWVGGKGEELVGLGMGWGQRLSLCKDW